MEEGTEDTSKFPMNSEINNRNPVFNWAEALFLSLNTPKTTLKTLKRTSRFLKRTSRFLKTTSRFLKRTSRFLGIKKLYFGIILGFLKVDSDYLIPLNPH